LETIFRTISDFSVKTHVLEQVLFFLRFLGRRGRFVGWVHMQSVHACAVETHFSVFAVFLKICSLKGVNGVKFGVDVGVFVEISVKKGASKHVSKKGAPPNANECLRVSIPLPGGSWAARLARALFKQETTI
jgi:hypothetical protein